ncbi:MAG TPA: PEGA domain-containing protein [Steroidobacteraceae bacterium]
MYKNIARPAALAGIAVLVMSGCATVIHGTRQDVGISSTPTGASVTIDNLQSGTTPVFAKLRRKENHVVRISLAGFQPIDLTLTSSVSGWVWGNIAIGGLIGLAVDAISGGMYKLSPEELSAALGTTSTKTVDRGADGINVVVVLKPEASWVKIAQLEAR